ncbi:MAG: methionyl-tRNA formyltransferase, partial [Gallionellaceae bacterium]
MKIIFAGTPEFAASALAALLDSGHKVAAVLTQPDRPAGRGMQLTQSPVKQLALRHQIPVLQPSSLKNSEILHQLAEFNADVMIVAAYGLILPTAVLQMPRYGCLNIHASLLPRWRGAAPIQRSLLAGDIETGITIMQMDEGLDTGAMLLKTHCPISLHDTTLSLHDKLEKLGAEAIITALEQLEAGNLMAVIQDNTAATYAAKISKAEAQLDWKLTAAELARTIRAYNPFPGAYTLLNGLPIKIWQATEVNAVSAGTAGSVVEISKQGIKVACGNGVLQ